MTETLRETPLQSEKSETLDPQNWDDIRAQGHRMLDDMIDYAANIRERPVWTPIPDAVRERFHEKLPHHPCDLGEGLPISFDISGSGRPNGGNRGGIRSWSASLLAHLRGS